MAEVEVIKVEDSDKKSLPYDVVRKHHVDLSKYKTPHQSSREKNRRLNQHYDRKETWPALVPTDIQFNVVCFS